MVKPVIHIGPPKTGSTSIQESLIPHLGRPYQCKPPWTRELSIFPEYEQPRWLTDDMIVSDELLGDFSRFSPDVIRERLLKVFSRGVIVSVTRSTKELFLSYYRQQIVNSLPFVLKSVVDGKAHVLPNDANGFFDIHRQRYDVAEIGFFALANSRRMSEAFSKRYTVVMIPFQLMRANPREFTRQFAAACESDTVAELQVVHSTTEQKLEDAIGQLPGQLPASVVERLTEWYRFPHLSSDRQAFLENWGS